MNGSVLISKTKEILNSDLDIDDANAAFLYAIFPFIEDVESDALTICNEAFPAYNIKLTGFFVNTDESLINIYSAAFDEYAGINTNLSYDTFNKMRIGMENII